MGKVILTGKGRRWALGGHPWIYRDDIAGGEGEPGELLPVEDPNQNTLGWGLFSSSSRIAVRMVTRSADQPDRAFWAERIARAVRARERAGLMEPADACRLVNGDADGLPGWVVDRYGATAVIQSTVQGSDRMRDFLVELLVEALPFPLDAIVERSDSAVRKHENLVERVQVLHGSVEGPVLVDEGDLRYEVDVLAGHKTGAYLDQRTNRREAAAKARGRRVLDAFSYDGLFGIRAALAGAETVVCVDQSEAAGERLVRNAELNGVAERVVFERANCMQDLRARKEAGERFGLAVIDPPAFARTKREVEGAERGYVELNLRAMGLVEEGGSLVSASCSYNVREDAFLRLLARASRDANRRVWLEQLRGASVDHSVLLGLPESAYLKCAFLRVE
ncbi:MAG: class I SAM-dependent rRNA methyltransferase [Planctomycetota bacterium]|nr:class I SAM-dependent rRNA methyltransferase [Planctomycetota bacterium]MDP6763845.1 class I SAM-dependent rRNA methyltransferase [Planctomycetota bacterium]MDP6988833.1 class I SAM-dependent rRNA methyltransferase [Planctomycetota bacterium]